MLAKLPSIAQGIYKLKIEEDVTKMLPNAGNTAAILQAMQSSKIADKLVVLVNGQGEIADDSIELATEYIAEKNIPCPNCGKHNFTDIRQFNLMFSTQMGAVQGEDSGVYLRPETAQGIFVNFLNVQKECIANR